MTRDKTAPKRKADIALSLQEAQLEYFVWATKKCKLECQKLQLEITRLQNES